MAELRPDPSGSPQCSDGDLEQRLDSLGRAVLHAEAGRAGPPGAFLRSVRQRSLFAATRTWSVRLAAAVAVAIGAAVAIYSMRSSPIPPSGGAISPIAVDPALPGVTPTDSTPTLARISAMNREASAEDEPRLPPGAVAAVGGAGESTLRASDSRRPERVESILGGR